MWLRQACCGGKPKLLLQARREKRIDLYTSTPLLAELTDILSRRKFEKKIAASPLSVDQLMDHYAGLARVVRPAPIPRIAPDPDDDAVIGAALAAKAGLLVTGDRRLLSVGDFQGVRIVGVVEALRVVAA